MLPTSGGNPKSARLRVFATVNPIEVFASTSFGEVFARLIRTSRSGTTRPTVPSRSATQNEIGAKDAENLVNNGVYVVSEGANMPTTPDGVNIFLEKKILFGPGKAANAGGVATSGLEMSQNSLRLSWTREEVDHRLQGIMKSIHSACVEASSEFGTPGNYVNGANIAGFLKIADTMLDQGVV